MKIQQFFDKESSTYTYVLFDEISQEAVIIDSVIEQFERDSEWLTDQGLKLRYILETHVHADHITAAFKLREKFGAKIALSKKAHSDVADINIDDGQEFSLGSQVIKAIATPGHTATCLSYYIPGAVFTGDTLLIGGCGRTDFQEGSAKQLFHSVRERLFRLPDETVVYPGHDYNGRLSSTIAEEKKSNQRLALSISEAEFIEIMDNLNLAEPKKIKQAVPANLRCGKGV